MANMLAFFKFGEMGFWLLILALVAVIVFYLISRNAE
jgi:hypothetical protein